jgi:chromosome segregation ATPase
MFPENNGSESPDDATAATRPPTANIATVDTTSSDTTPPQAECKNVGLGHAKKSGTPESVSGPRSRRTSSPINQSPLRRSSAKKTAILGNNSTPKVFNHAQIQEQATQLGPSEEDLLLVLMHRCRERGLESIKADAKTQKLELQVFELHAENIELLQERENLSLAQNRLQEEYQELRSSIDVFKARFKKVKNLGDHINHHFEMLREDSKEINKSIADLRDTGKEVQASIQEATTSVQKYEAELHGHKAKVATVELDVANKLKDASTKSAVEANIVKDLRRDKGRLEAHVLNLEHARQKHDLATTESHKGLSSELSKVTSRLDEIDTAVTVNHCLSEFVEQCSSIITPLQKELEAQRDRTGALIGDLNKTITKEGDSVRCAIRHLSNVEASAVLKQTSDDLKGHMNKKLSTLLHSQAEIARLEEQLKGSQSLVEQLRKDVDRSDSLVDSLRKDIETSSAVSGAQLEIYIEVEKQRDVLQEKCTSTKAELTVERQNARQKAAEAEAEVERLRKLADHVEFERQAIEKRLAESQEELTVLRKTNERILREVRLPQIVHPLLTLKSGRGCSERSQSRVPAESGDL